MDQLEFLLKKNLFSKLTGAEYMKTYSKNNFYSKYTVVEYCPDAFQLVNKDNTLKKKLLKITKFKHEPSTFVFFTS